MLNKYYKEDLNGLLVKVKNFKWKNGSVRISQSNKKLYKFRGTGSQNLEFFNAFSILDEKIDRSSDDYKLYYYCRRLINFFFSTILYKKDLKKVQDELHQFYYYYFQQVIIPSNFKTTFTFKMHHLFHYVDLIKKFGPLQQFSTLKFERKHQTFKRIIRSSNCRKNLPYSSIKWANYKNFSKYTLSSRDQVLKKIKINDFQDSIYCDEFNKKDDVFELKSTIKNNLKFELFEFYIHRSNFNDLPQIVKIIKILRQNQIVKIYAQCYNILEFNDTDFFYKLFKTNEVVEIKNL